MIEGEHFPLSLLIMQSAWMTTHNISSIVLKIAGNACRSNRVETSTVNLASAWLSGRKPKTFAFTQIPVSYASKLTLPRA